MTEQLLATEAPIAFKSTADLKKAADRMTQRSTLVAAGAGLIPIPILDAAAILGVQINMIRVISNIYHVEFRENIAKSIIGSLVGSVGAVSLVKAIPVIGSMLGGVTVSVGAAAATYALGKVFTQHFDQGGTLLDFDPVKSRAYFEKEFEAGRMYSSDVVEVEKEVVKEKEASSGLLDLFSGKKKKQEEAERKEMVQTNKDLIAAVAQLREEIAAMKKI